MINDLPADEPTPLPNISSKHLAIIIDSLNAIASITNTENYAYQVEKALGPLFLCMPFIDVIDILKAVHFLDIPVLLKYCTALIVSQLKRDTNLDRIASLINQLNELPT